ncbi:Flagellar M-ring protein FliF [Olavius algarvensis spirochete endosymbiont]|uniref:flagellar basal-body MS-ring/collar protein FliF n=1 Tax=Olavius algarvensis spirochete endosymbiont TaxID=260710 RepID=UPI000F20F626|nr:flagellar basal-body MS-ring/collar protein FliF [Olavius algarvensis spirochete endosymbiont]CAD7843592.1 MAG: Flagellar M-ring protein FliF [Olavius algarvensis spirochete endosymbiont]VDA99337.1 Flagellar M-ring protein FliF [Olavius algarvensis spirochete endosymbiont]
MWEWLKSIGRSVRTFWNQWSTVKKLILTGIIATVIASFVILVAFSAKPTQVIIFNAAITDESLADRISAALDIENIAHSRGADGRFYTADEETAKQARSLLVREDLLPGQLDPWNFFTNMERWTLTDFDRDINLQRALKINLEQHISSLDDVDSAKISLVIPKEQLFVEDQKSVTASVVIQQKPGSDISENRSKIEGIVKLIQFAVEGLSAENITIMNINGDVLNDFEGLEDVDRLTLTSRMLRQKKILEAQYTAAILESLYNVFTPSRVDIVNFDIDLDFVKKEISTQEHFPVVITEDNPSTPYSEREVVPSIVRSRENNKESFEGTGFNPEGPPGQEGQTPPAYQDLTNLVGRYDSDRSIENYEINVRNITEERSPYEVKRISLGMVIDGTWEIKFDAMGEPIVNPGGLRERVYKPVSAEVLSQAQQVVEGAVGYSRLRGDVVTVENIPFDRSEQFRLDDEAWLRKQAIQQYVIWGAIVLGAFVAIFIIARIVGYYVTRRRREREEELAREHQEMREAALRDAEEDGIDVEMSIQERSRIEMQENAKIVAREHPEDVAQLIRTWLTEE